MTTETAHLQADASPDARQQAIEPVAEILACPDYRPVRLDDAARILGFQVEDYADRLAMEGAVRRWLDGRGTPAYRIGKHWIVPLGRLRDALRRLAGEPKSP